MHHIIHGAVYNTWCGGSSPCGQHVAALHSLRTRQTKIKNFGPQKKQKKQFLLDFRQHVDLKMCKLLTEKFTTKLVSRGQSEPKEGFPAEIVGRKNRENKNLAKNRKTYKKRGEKTDVSPSVQNGLCENLSFLGNCVAPPPPGVGWSWCMPAISSDPSKTPLKKKHFWAPNAFSAGGGGERLQQYSPQNLNLGVENALPTPCPKHPSGTSNFLKKTTTQKALSKWCWHATPANAQI